MSLPAELQSLIDALARSLARDASADTIHRRAMDVATAVTSAMALADMRARASMLNDRLPPIVLQVGEVSAVFGAPAIETIESFISRKPILEDSAEELVRRYGSARVFGFTGAPTLDAVRAAQRFLAEALAGQAPGLATFEERMKGVAKLLSQRVETIYRTNISTANAVGRLEGAKRNDRIVGFMRFATHDRRTRPNHAAAHRKCYDKNAQDIQRFLLPWGFNCRCTDTPLTRALAQRYNVWDKQTESVVDDWPVTAHRDAGFSPPSIL